MTGPCTRLPTLDGRWPQTDSGMTREEEAPAPEPTSPSSLLPQASASRRFLSRTPMASRAAAPPRFWDPQLLLPWSCLDVAFCNPQQPRMTDLSIASELTGGQGQRLKPQRGWGGRGWDVEDTDPAKGAGTRGQLRPGWPGPTMEAWPPGMASSKAGYKLPQTDACQWG